MADFLAACEAIRYVKNLLNYGTLMEAAFLKETQKTPGRNLAFKYGVQIDVDM